jgi:glutamate formiminotransferase/formiminotetrahydrofolate cyclodeaminase
MTMSKRALIECVPNFSEGRDLSIIKQITDEIESVEGVRLLDVDPGKATNRTVVTFVGEPEPVVKAAFLAIKKAAELIDMSKHQGEHPRMGATDVCPLVPVANISLDEVAQWAHKLGEMVGQALDIPFYMYEHAATRPERKNLASIRAGEYEALPDKLKKPEWKPDYGPARFNPRAGATAIGARDFLIAYNINLNTTSVRRANSVAFDVREKGRAMREGDPVTGKVVLDEQGEPRRVPGACKAVKGIGWYIEEYGIAQISMNLTDIRVTPLHIAFEACCESATRRGLRVTGSELVGLVPKRVLLDAGRYFLRKQQRSVGLPEEELIHIAVRTLGLDELAPFDPKKKVIEYLLEEASSQPLIHQSLRQFTHSVMAETPTPGGGSVSAYVGALGASLAGMVANLSSHKRGWDERWEFFSNWAEKAQELQEALLRLVDEDTQAFNRILDAFRMPKGSEDEKYARMMAVEAATRYAIEVPLQVMERCVDALDLLRAMVHEGNPNSLSDAAVGMLCTRAALRGAYLNVRINLSGLKDKDFAAEALRRGQELDALMAQTEEEMMEYVLSKL